MKRKKIRFNLKRLYTSKSRRWAEKVKESEAFIKIANKHGIDVNKLSDAEIKARWDALIEARNREMQAKRHKHNYKVSSWGMDEVVIPYAVTLRCSCGHTHKRKMTSKESWLWAEYEELSKLYCLYKKKLNEFHQKHPQYPTYNPGD